MRGYNVISVTIDALTKPAHLIRMNIIYLIEKLAEVYISEIIKHKILDLALSLRKV